ncbi:hypothetical protein M3Y98_01215200 [Aphelenchoides besseyi]|nr:hypothetical protein M3Y98_01215200 [Aphelenchoides besseyi]KAI6193279.1 hypothetical protein M3Y96_01001500 [Aphelenchoides besseyi]
MKEVRLVMKMAGLSHVAIVYMGLVTMVYLATDGFRKNAPFVFTFPVVILGVVTLNTRMPVRKKLFTAAQTPRNFPATPSGKHLFVAAALYQWSMNPRQLELNAALICASHACYLLSFIRAVKKWWKTLAIVTSVFTVIFFYTVFYDLFRSLPMVVVVCCLTNGVIALSFVAAGSVWKKGSQIAYAETAAFSRFMGIFLLLLCDVALLSNQFARHTQQLTWYLNLCYYVSQYLLFTSNVRAF